MSWMMRLISVADMTYLPIGFECAFLLLDIRLVALLTEQPLRPG